MLVVVRYLNDASRNGMNVIEDWFLPKGALKTAFTDDAGRVLYLVGTDEQITKESKRLDKKGATLDHLGHVCTYKAKK
jgi:hypothetical protein